MTYIYNERYRILERDSDRALIFLAKKNFKLLNEFVVKEIVLKFLGYPVRESPGIIFYSKRNKYISLL